MQLAEIEARLRDLGKSIGKARKARQDPSELIAEHKRLSELRRQLTDSEKTESSAAQPKEEVSTAVQEADQVSVSTRLLWDLADFSSLGEKWDDLLRLSPQNSSLAESGALTANWNQSGGSYRTMVLVVNNGEGDLVGGLPLVSDTIYAGLLQRWRAGILAADDTIVPVAPIARRGMEPEVVEGAIRGLVDRKGQWDQLLVGSAVLMDGRLTTGRRLVRSVA